MKNEERERKKTRSDILRKPLIDPESERKRKSKKWNDLRFESDREQSWLANIFEIIKSIFCRRFAIYHTLNDSIKMLVKRLLKYNLLRFKNQLANYSNEMENVYHRAPDFNLHGEERNQKKKFASRESNKSECGVQLRVPFRCN